MRKKTRGLVLLVLAYIAFFPIEFSVAQDPPRANNLGGQGGFRVFRKRESPVLFSQQGEVRFQKAYVDQNGSIRADGHNLDLFGAVLIRRDRICTSGQGARWTCGQRAYMALRALLGGRQITCSFKPISVPPKAVCSVDDQDIAQFLLREGWAELPVDVTDQAYVEASELAQSRGLGIWGDGPTFKTSRTWHRAPQQSVSYSITSSARARNASGIISPIALALLRLITSSNFV